MQRSRISASIGIHVSTEVLEAALHGCALVLGDTPALRELWGDAAVFLSVRNSNA